MKDRPDPVFYGPLEFLADQELREAWDSHDRVNELGDVPPGTGTPDSTVVRFPPRLRLVDDTFTNATSVRDCTPDAAA
jgi:hypothetical protein